MQTGLVRRPLCPAAAAALAAVATGVLLAACASGPASHHNAGQHTAGPPSPGPAGHAPAGPGRDVAGRATDWPQYHLNAARTGAAAGLPPAGPLHVAWTAALGGTVTGQPLVIGDTVIAATERDDVYGLSRTTGRIRWRTRVGSPVPVSDQPCGNLNPLGIASTGVYDPQDGLVYVVAQDGRSGQLLAGLSLTGHVRVRVRLPALGGPPAYEQQRAALALSHGYVYVAFGGHAGDCGPYLGLVEAVPASGSGRILAYRVPTARQGGIWAPGGPAIGPAGTVYVSVGNGATTSARFDGSDSVTALSPVLQRTGIFAPSDWRTLSAGDLDLGSMSPALLPDGQILQVGKSGTGYLLDAAHLGGIGGQVAQGRVCPAFGGAAVSGQMAYVPCGTGLAAVDTAGNRVTVRWRGPAGGSGSPVLGGGAVWVAGAGNGMLYELSPASGRVRQQIQVASQLPHFVSPALSGRLILIGTLTGVSAIAGG